MFTNTKKKNQKKNQCWRCENFTLKMLHGKTPTKIKAKLLQKCGTFDYPLEHYVHYFPFQHL